MGIKNIKERYAPDFIVQRHKDRRITFGVNLCPELVTVSKSGVKQSSIADTEKWQGIYEDIENGIETGEFIELLEMPDSLGPLMDVCIAERGRVVKKQCEADSFGWPNITTDGVLMYDNTTFKIRAEALKYVRSSSVSELICGFEYGLIDQLRSLWKAIKITSRDVYYLINAWVFWGY